MEIGIIGLGFVGSALEKSFRQNNISLQVYDKYKSIGSIDLIYKTDIVFLCLPTLYKDNSYDLSSIHEICSLLNNSYKGLVVIKSTVEPLTTVNLNKEIYTAWVYWYNGDTNGLPQLASGDVMQYLHEKNK